MDLMVLRTFSSLTKCIILLFHKCSWLLLVAKQLHFKFPGRSLCCSVELSSVFCFFLLVQKFSRSLLQKLSAKNPGIGRAGKGDLWEEGKTQTTVGAEYLTADPVGCHPFSCWKYGISLECSIKIRINWLNLIYLGSSKLAP